jgi:serine/threonine protein phosphatase PrpC
MTAWRPCLTEIGNSGDGQAIVILTYFGCMIIPNEEMSTNNWASFGMTHTGKIRQINQDTFLNLPDKQLWMVADGMGGHQAGEFASSAIADALKSVKPGKTLGATLTTIYRELLKVNRELIELASESGDNSVIGSTIAILLVWRQHGIILWSGDSRIYLFRRGILRQLSRDHNYGNQLLAKGYSAEEVKTQPFTQTLTHAIGGAKELYLEAQMQEIRPGDIFLLCSDGLNKEVADSEIESILNTIPIEQAVSKLMEFTLNRGARDNVTIVTLTTSVIA